MTQISNLSGMASKFRLAVLIAILLSGTATAQQGPSEQAGESINADRLEDAIKASGPDAARDPWEGFNRAMFSAQTLLDDTVLVPISLGYRAVTPKRGRRGIRRFLANLRTPGVLLNDLLQGEFSRAGKTATRFMINSTIGAGGFADPAALLGYKAHREDFGQTLAVWGVDSGPYLFLPLIGPSTARDTIGNGAQVFLDPLFHIRTPPANIGRLTRAGVGGISAREAFIEPLAEMRENSLDYYASFRSFYLQSRQRQILNGQTDLIGLPDIGDEFDELEELDEIK